ncbi:PREDICTED: floral homeotic protein GLOBOSA-like [Erythranthe guttata]|nr:PREDICTED: floral homeotic protein GLOBOSA-like [Erythranthe guttata]|eukprot:XP_012842298.1 PREDICTED: floral homeotic protein GLOBOSA-like [Erythranthe guttata]
MGRGKLKLELMRNEKSRRLSFKKRKDGLINKLHQLTTLCDVTACMIIFDDNSNYQEPDIWPRDPEKVRRIVESYDSPKSVSTFGLSDFFRDRTKTVEDELKKLRKSNLESKFPIRHEFLDSLTESQLREFGDALKNKARIAKSRIDFLKNQESTMKQEFSSMDFGNLDRNQETASSSSSVNQNNSVVMMDFAHAPKRFGLDPPHEDFCTWNNIHDDQETDFASNNNHQNNSVVMMMDFDPEILGFDPARDLSAWDFDEQEIDSCLKEISDDATNFDDRHYCGPSSDIMIPQHYYTAAAPVVVEDVVLPPQLQYWENDGGDQEEDILQFFDGSFWS